jgi:hypothetical protein
MICLKCLNKNPADRYASADELAADLEAYLAGEPIRARPQSTLEQIVRAIRHHNLDERVVSAGTFLLLWAPVCLLAHLVTYALFSASPRFPALITAVSMLTLVGRLLAMRLFIPNFARAFPRAIQHRLRNVWGAHAVALLLAPLLVWLVVGFDQLLLVYPVWQLLAGLALFALADLLGFYHLVGGVIFAASLLSALAPAWAPLILGTLASLSMAFQGLFFRSVRRLGRQDETQHPD